MVQPNEEGVVTTFGAYSRTERRACATTCPPPSRQVEKVSATSLNRIDVGGADRRPVPEESLMLTGDENIVDLNFSVTWRVADAAKFLFTRDPDVSP
jgi:membrane protease subunit HflK